MTKSNHAMDAKHGLLKRADGISPPTTFGDLIKADHKFLGLGNMSQEIITQALQSHRMDIRVGVKVTLRKSQDAAETSSCP